MDNHSPETVRTAAYLAARERLDLKGKLKCNPPNRACGDRCIPPSWKCRVKGEGTDSHSRVVAGDPLAGAAAIARGRRRLVTGFKKGSLTDIQGGRAAIERGIVKAVPGQNIKQKQALRRTINKALLPVATGIFSIWALQRGHEGLKLVAPQYRNGIGRDIEVAMGDAISWGLDRVPISGALRVQQRRRAGLEAQRIGRAVTRGITFDPGTAGGGERYLPYVSTRERRAFTGLDTAIKEAYARNGGGNYANFRSDIMSSTIGANVDGKSLYSEVAAAHHLARRFSIDPSTITNRDGADSRFHIENRISAALTTARSTMRQDMLQRGLDPKNPADVSRYVDVARQSAAQRMRGLTPAQQQSADDLFNGYVRDIVSLGKTTKDEISTRAIASSLFKETQDGFDKSFKDFARTIKEDTSPTTRVIASGEAGSSIRTALIGTANRLKRDVGLEDGYTIKGANHAELILQKVWYEKVVPGNYSSRSTSTWNPTSDGAIRYAAQDMGWAGSSTDDAVEFLRANGFSRLERRPAAAPRPSAQPRATTGTTRPARRRERSRAEIIAMLTRGPNPLSPEAAAAEADRIRARRGDADDFTPELVRTATYLAARADFKEGKRLGKPCGASHIPKAHECRKGKGAANNRRESDGQKSAGLSLKQAASLAATVGTGVLTAKMLSDPKARQKLVQFDAYIKQSAKDAQYKVRQETLARSIDGLSSKQLRQGLDKLPASLKKQAYDLVGKAKKGAAAMSLELAGYTPTKVDTENNYISFTNRQGDIKSIGSVGDNLVSYTFHDVQGEAANILPKGRKSKHVVFQIDRKFDQKTAVAADDTKAIKNMLTAMFRDSVSKVDDGTLLLNSAWDKDGKGSGRAALYRRYGFNDVQGVDGMQWAVVENGAVKRVPKANAMSEFMTILESGRADSVVTKTLYATR